MPPLGLHGRTTELAWLRCLWDAATARDTTGKFVGGPRLAVIAAETGYGKTRLVQALYQQLTQDPVWDPAEINYWPDAFQGAGEQLRVNPDPKGHVPAGPPQFLWLGMRWQPTEVRNIDERSCAIPTARDVLQVHVSIADRHRPAWQHARAELERSMKRSGIVGSLARAADLAVPFGELGVRLMKGAADLARDRSPSRRDIGSERERQSGDAAAEFLAELREVFGGAGSAGRVLPTVLWLDDAQWIDGTTLRFLQDLWREAHERSWPLLIAVTHWEREWEELRASRGDRGLAALEGEPGVEVLRLRDSTREDLGAYLGERLPGLAASQRELLLDKAGGNFLTMVENVGELLANPEAFVAHSASGQLTADGERFVREWESDRQRRIEQRFSRLASEVRTVLGWGSALGIRFLRDVVADHARRTGLSPDPEPLIEACVTPFAILGTPTPNVREFRDRAFHVVARKHFERWGSSQGASLRETLRGHLVRWINGSFDDEGSVLRPEPSEGWKAPVGAAIFLSPEERRDLLSMAVGELRLRDDPDWDDPADAAALRARILLAWTDEFERLLQRVRQTASLLVNVDWDSVPGRVISPADRLLCAIDWRESGANLAARQLLEHLAHEASREAQQDPGEDSEARMCIVLSELRDVESALGAKERALALAREVVRLEEMQSGRCGSRGAERDLAIALIALSDLQMALDDLEGSRDSCRRSLAIRERLLGEEPSTQDLRDLSVALDQLGHLDSMIGRDELAEASYRRSLEISRRIADEDRSIEARRDLAISLINVAPIARTTDGVAASLELLEEALRLTRDCAAEEDLPDLQEDVAHVLELVGDTEADLDLLDSAWSRLEESLSIRRALEDSSPTPDRRRGISTTLSNMASIAERRDQLETALALAQEALLLDREAVRELRTSKSLRDLGVALTTAARLEADLGLDGAEAHAREALEVRRETLAASARPLHRHDLWESHRLLARLALERRDESIIGPARDWLDFHRSLKDEGSTHPVAPLAGAVAFAALMELANGRSTGAAVLASAALELIGPRTSCHEDPSTVEFTARLIASGVLVAAMLELGEGWKRAASSLKDALDLAKILEAKMSGANPPQPDFWDATGCCLAFKGAEQYFRTRGDERSADRSAELVRRWERRIEDAD